MKNIVITGSSSGVGLAQANYFSSRGHQVVGISRNPPQNGGNEQWLTIPLDLTSTETYSKLPEIFQSLGKIDCLINNAGRGMIGPVEGSHTEITEILFRLNVMAVLETTSAVLPTMRAQEFGKIINISSLGSEMGLPFRGLYSASKAAVDKITESLRYEVKDFGIQACSVHLGDVATPIALSRLHTEIPHVYDKAFAKVSHLMDAHVDEGVSAEDVALFMEKLIDSSQLQAHYYFGKIGQKIGVPLKKILPYSLYEKLMRKYNGM